MDNAGVARDAGPAALVLPPRAISAARARDLVTARCRAWDLDSLAGDVALVVTELVANAIRHAGTDMELRVTRIERGIRVELFDGSTRPLRPRSAGASDEGGRGLMILDALSHRYGVDAQELGKRVWAELLLDGPLDGPLDGR